MQGRMIKNTAADAKYNRDDELRNFEIRQFRERAYNGFSYNNMAITAFRLSAIPFAASMIVGGIGGSALPIYLAATGHVPQGEFRHMGTAMEGGLMLGMGAGMVVGAPVTAIAAGLSGGTALITHYAINNNLNKAAHLAAASGPISTGDKVAKKDVLLNKLIEEINAVHDMPSLIEKTKEICDNDAEALRTERGVYSYSFFKNYVGNKLGHQQGNTKSWNALKDTLKKRSFILGVTDDISTAFDPIASLLEQVEKGQQKQAVMRPS